MKRAAVVFALAAFFSSCGPRNYVVLLDNPGGGHGEVIVSNEKGRQTLDESGNATAINRKSSPPSSPWKLEVKKIQDVFARAFGARPPRFVHYTIYFKSGGTRIEPESQKDVNAMLAEVRKRPGVDCTVAGHADRAAPARYNEVIALERAYLIRDMLVRAGVPIERIEMDSYGETRPAIPTPDNVPELRNRRVEVTVR